MVLLGGINFHCVAAAAILKPVEQAEVRYRKMQNDVLADDSNDIDRNFVKAFFKDVFNISLFRNGPFMVLLIFQVISGYIFNGWVVYFVSFGLSKGLTPVSAANVPMFSGIAVFVIRCSFSIVSNPPPARRLLYLGALLEAISFAGFYFANSFWTLSSASFIFGFGYGIVGSQIYIAVNNVVTKEINVGALAWIQLLHGIGYMISGYATGELDQLIKVLIKTQRSINNQTIDQSDKQVCKHANKQASKQANKQANKAPLFLKHCDIYRTFKKTRLLPDLKRSQNVPKHSLFKLCKFHEKRVVDFFLEVKMCFLMIKY